MDWLTYFEENRIYRKYIPWEKGIEVESHLKIPLIHSLQRFQIGEDGDGIHLRANAATIGDPIYSQTIELFIQEEAEHATILRKILEGLEADLLTHHWSDRYFMWVRRLMGLHLELTVLLSVEMVARRYYRALFEGTQDPLLRAAFGQIVQDEAAHVAFHRDFLRQSFSNRSKLLRWLTLQLWRLFFWGVCSVVLWDHRAVLQAIDVSPWTFWRDCQQIFNQTTRPIFNLAKHPWQEKLEKGVATGVALATMGYTFLLLGLFVFRRTSRKDMH
ncbi:MAG: ferritin-like domain-containing protein [Chloroflexota bacterium]